MSILKANCPSCGAPIEFRKGSTIVLVCPFCRSAVARTDRGLQDLGKVAEIVDSLSPLKIGLRGNWKTHSFELTGRIRKLHELGGVWDEWYATFSNGWVGWLAEAQGKFYLTFNQPLTNDERLPPFESLTLGQQVPQIPSKNSFLVAEKGVATALAAEGEIPFPFVPQQKTNFADLSGANDAFATIDYGKNPARVFVGELVDLAEIGLGNAKPKTVEAQKVSSAAMQCPNCAGALNLVAPDQAMRVTCPFCKSLLDINQGNLKFLESLKNPREYILPIGAEVSFGQFENGAKFKLIGAMTRSVTIDGTKYFWDEYLLYNPLVGFRWLIHSDNHWNWVEPVNVADVADEIDSVTFQNKSFRAFQDAKAAVEYVTGEFYWKVTQGESVQAIDYIAPPYMLSVEKADKEINCSQGTYLKREDVVKAFNVENIPNTVGYAPNEPFPANKILRTSLIMLAAAVLYFTAMSYIFEPSSTVAPTDSDQRFTLAPKNSPDEKTVVYSAPFRMNADLTSSIYVSTNIDYEKWAEFDVSLVIADSQNNKNNLAQVKPSEENSYLDWTLKSVPTSTGKEIVGDGEYQLRAEGKWQEWQKPLNLRMEIRQYSSSESLVGIFMIMLFSVFPILLLLYKAYFENNRWENSNLSPPNFFVQLFSGVFSRGK